MNCCACPLRQCRTLLPATPGLMVRRFFKALLLLFFVVALLAGTVFLYALSFSLPACGLQVPTSPIPFRFAFGGGFNSYFPSILTSLVTFNSFRPEFNTDDPTYTSFVTKGWNSLQHTQRSWTTANWLSGDLLDASHHLLFFSSTHDILVRRKARAVASLQLYKQSDTHTTHDPENELATTPLHRTLTKWSSRKLTNYLRKRLNQIEQVEVSPPSSSFFFAAGAGGAAASSHDWLQKYKKMNDRKKLIATVWRIQTADVCLKQMPWWSLPTANPEQEEGRSFRILIVWGTTVIGFLGCAIFMVSNEFEEDGRRRARRQGEEGPRNFGGLGKGDAVVWMCLVGGGCGVVVGVVIGLH